MIYRFKFKTGDKVEVAEGFTPRRGRVIACECLELCHNGYEQIVNRYVVSFDIEIHRYAEHEMRRVKRWVNF